MQTSGIYRLGPFGRGVHVDDGGALLVRDLASSGGGGGGDVSQADIAPFQAQVFTSGAKIEQGVYNRTTGLVQWKDSLYIGTHAWVGSTEKKVYKIDYSEASGVTWQTAFEMPLNASGGWPGTLIVFRDKLYTSNLDGSTSGIVWEWDGTNLVNIGMPSGSDADVFAGTGQRASIMWGLGLFDNKLIIGTANHIDSGPQAIFTWDGSASGASSFGVLYKQRTTGSNWGWTQGFNTYGDKFFTFNANDDYFNCFDGVRGVWGYVPDGKSVKGCIPFKGKLYGVGKGIWEFLEDQIDVFSPGPWAKVYDTNDELCMHPTIYNGKMFFGDQAGKVHEFDGHSWRQIADLEKEIVALGVLEGRLFVAAKDGTIWHMTDSTETARDHGLDNPNPTALWYNKEYIKKYGEYMGNQPPFYNSTGKDVKRFPYYSSSGVITQEADLTTAIGELDQALSLLAVPSSGTFGDLPAVGSSSFGDSFYVVGSGFYRRGISGWEQVTVA